MTTVDIDAVWQHIGPQSLYETNWDYCVYRIEPKIDDFVKKWTLGDMATFLQEHGLEDDPVGDYDTIRSVVETAIGSWVVREIGRRSDLVLAHAPISFSVQAIAFRIEHQDYWAVYTPDSSFGWFWPMVANPTVLPLSYVWQALFFVASPASDVSKDADNG